MILKLCLREHRNTHIIDNQVAGGAFYPAAVEAWQNNSRIASNSSYIMMIVSEDCDAVVSEFNALFS